jgi:hypothetical protein
MSKQRDFLKFAEHCRLMVSDRRCTSYSELLADMEQAWRRLAIGDEPIVDHGSNDDRLRSELRTSSYEHQAGAGRFLDERPAPKMAGSSEAKTDLPAPSMFETTDGRPLIVAPLSAPRHSQRSRPLAYYLGEPAFSLARHPRVTA